MTLNELLEQIERYYDDGDEEQQERELVNVLESFDYSTIETLDEMLFVMHSVKHFQRTIKDIREILSLKVIPAMNDLIEKKYKGQAMYFNINADGVITFN